MQMLGGCPFQSGTVHPLARTGLPSACSAKASFGHFAIGRTGNKGHASNEQGGGFRRVTSTASGSQNRAEKDFLTRNSAWRTTPRDSPLSNIQTAGLDSTNDRSAAAPKRSIERSLQTNEITPVARAQTRTRRQPRGAIASGRGFKAGFALSFRASYSSLGNAGQRVLVEDDSGYRAHDPSFSRPDRRARRFSRRSDGVTSPSATTFGNHSYLASRHEGHRAGKLAQVRTPKRRGTPLPDFIDARDRR